MQFLNRYGGTFKTFTEKTLNGTFYDYVLPSGTFPMTFSNGSASASRTLKVKAHKDVFKFTPQKSGLYFLTVMTSAPYSSDLNTFSSYVPLTIKLLDSSQKTKHTYLTTVSYNNFSCSLTAGKTYYLSAQSAKLQTGFTQSYDLHLSGPISNPDDYAFLC